MQTDGSLVSGAAGAILTMNGDLTMDGGLMTTINNNPFTVDLNGNTMTLNSGTLKGGVNNAGRDLIFANAVLAGSGTITIQGGDSDPTKRTDVRFQNSVDASGFTGLFTSSITARFFLPEVTVEDASFAINIGGSSGIGLANSLAVTSANLGGVIVPVGTWTRDELINDLGVNSNRILTTGYTDGTLTVIPEPGTLGLVVAFGGGLIFIRRKFMV